MESATLARNEDGRVTGSLFHSNQIAAFHYSEAREVFASRVTKCISRAFEAIGASTATQQVIFWNLSVTHNLGQAEVASKPTQFIEGLRAIYGEAAMVVYEYKLMKEIRKEFGLTEDEMKFVEGHGLADVLQIIEPRAVA
jgi:hypothetical protein